MTCSLKIQSIIFGQLMEGKVEGISRVTINVKMNLREINCKELKRAELS
jgi:hypothetical protein